MAGCVSDTGIPLLTTGLGFTLGLSDLSEIFLDIGLIVHGYLSRYGGGGDKKEEYEEVNQAGEGRKGGKS